MLSATRRKILGGIQATSTNVMCVIPKLDVILGIPGNGGLEKSKKELESLETKTFKTQVSLHEFKFKQNVNQIFDIGKSTRELVEEIEETTKNPKNEPISN